MEFTLPPDWGRLSVEEKEPVAVVVETSKLPVAVTVTLSRRPVALTVKDCWSEAVPSAVSKPERLVGVAVMTGPDGGRAMAGMAAVRRAAKAARSKERGDVFMAAGRWSFKN